MMPRRNERHRGQTDAELVSALAAGDVDALGGLYDRHYAGLLRFVRRIVVPSHDAEDVAQEAFLVLTRNAASFDVAQRFRPWLFGIAARIVLQRRRARAR